jgi:Ca2+-binding EF-hand superfamily protein
VDKNAQSVFERTHELIRKMVKLFQSKKVSIFDAFVLFDVNGNGELSKMELRLGLQQLDCPITEADFGLVWNAFSKKQTNKVNFAAFLTAFVQAGAVQVVKFSESIETLVGRFAAVMKKFGNFEEGFSQLDRNHNGFVTALEFRDRCHRVQLGFRDDELDLLFRAFCTGGEIVSKGVSDPEEDTKVIRNFPFRLYVKTLSKSVNRNVASKVFAKLRVAVLERKYKWQQMFEAHETESKRKNLEELSLRDLKAMLKNAKLGLSNEELDVISNEFDHEVINYKEIETKLEEAHQKEEAVVNEKQNIITSLSGRMQEEIARENIPLERLFFDFDTKQSGTLDLVEFMNLVYFLKVTSNKQHIRFLFEDIDVQKHGYITLTELRMYFDENAYLKKRTEDVKAMMSKEITREKQINTKIKEGLLQSRKTLVGIFQDLKIVEENVLTKKGLEHVLRQIDLVFSNEELEILEKHIKERSAFKVINYRNLIEYFIKEQIEVPDHDEKKGRVHPTVALYVYKMNRIFKNLELSSAGAYKYFLKLGHPTITKKDFLKYVQGLGLGFSKEDLLLLYEYFDERGYGEIYQETFVERMENLSVLSMKRFHDEANAGKSPESSGPSRLETARFSTRQSVIAILQKIYFFMHEKKYNRQQLTAMFDKNGNGMLSLEELFECLKMFGFEISLEKARLVMSFIDKTERGFVDVDDFVSQVFESVPQSTFITASRRPIIH